MFGDPIKNEKGWKKQKGHELFEFSSGKFLEEKYRKKEGIPVYGGNGVVWYTDKELVKDRTIIIGRVGIYCGNIKLSMEPVWITDNAIYIKKFKNDFFELEFLYFLMNFINISKYADFSGQPKITQKPLLNENYIVPPLSLQNEFARKIEGIDKLKFIRISPNKSCILPRKSIE